MPNPPKSRALQVLAQNLNTLMGAENAQFKNSRAIAAKAKAQGRKLSYKTVDRTLALDNEPGTDKIEAMAKVFGLEAWQLLIPGLQAGEKPEIKREVVVEG